MRKPLIAGNWKMNKTVKESVGLVSDLKKLVKGVKDRDILVCPTFTALSSVAEQIKGSNIMLGAQNMHFEEEGAFTGEISAKMLKEIGCKYVILGHSERRHIFNEDDELINKKVKTGLASGLKVILCVGETLEEREKGDTEKVVERHVKKGLNGVSSGDMKNVIIAYEPVWAIGTGKTATPEQAEEVHKLIRGLLGKLYGKIADNTLILYGGSVKPDNIKGLMDKEDIDGGLVGGASLDAKSFSEIVKY